MGKLHHLFLQVCCHARWILPLLDLTQQIEIVDIQRQQPCVFWVLLIGCVLGPFDHCRTPSGFDLLPVSLDSCSDPFFRKAGIPSPWILKPLLSPETEPQSVSMPDFIPPIHEQEKVTQVVGILYCFPKVRFQHRSKGRLLFGLAQPLYITKGPRSLPF